MGDDVVLEATFLLPPLTFLGMGVVGEGLVDTSFFLVGVPVLLLTGVLLFSTVLEPGVTSDQVLLSFWSGLLLLYLWVRICRSLLGTL